MPTVNIYYKNQKDYVKLDKIVNKLKLFLANELTCKNIRLRPEEVSIRLITVKGSGTMGAVEVEITAYEFPERVKKQDKICRSTAKYLKGNISIRDVEVWLKLCKLGHSFT